MIYKLISNRKIQILILFMLAEISLFAEFKQPKNSLEKYNIILKKSCINQDKIGNKKLEKGGDPQVQVLINKKIVYDTIRKFKNITGPLNTYNDRFSFNYKQGDEITVKLIDRDLVEDDLLFSKTSSSKHAIQELLNSKIGKDGSWTEFSIDNRAGVYRVKLTYSFISADDFEAIGGVFENRKIAHETLDFLELLNKKDGISQKADALYKKSKKILVRSIEKGNHRIIVYQNDKKIFDTYPKTINKEGVVCKWNKSFDINWKPCDKIKVCFYDIDTTMDDNIFSKESNTKNSIDIFQGILFGGTNGNSGLNFSIKKIK